MEEHCADVLRTLVRRRCAVGLTMQSVALEGGCIEPDLAPEFANYANGLIDSHELVSRVRCHYGLDGDSHGQ